MDLEVYQQKQMVKEMVEAAAVGVVEKVLKIFLMEEIQMEVLEEFVVVVKMMVEVEVVDMVVEKDYYYYYYYYNYYYYC